MIPAEGIPVHQVLGLRKVELLNDVLFHLWTVDLRLDAAVYLSCVGRTAQGQTGPCVGESPADLSRGPTPSFAMLCRG